MPIWLIGAIGLLGGSIGGTLLAGVLESFTARDTYTPWPICAACRSQKQWVLFVPILGPLLLWKDLRGCVWHPAIRIVQTQLAVGVTWAILAGCYNDPGLLLITATDAYILWMILFIDVQHRVIPTILIVPAGIFALFTSIAWPHLGIVSSMLGGILAFGFFEVLVKVAERLFGVGAFGQGDANLAGLIGLCFGYPLVIVPLSLGVFLGGIGAGIFIVLSRRERLHTAFQSTIPYGPFLVAGALFILCRGNTLHSVFEYMAGTY